jgi:hypothetical protein
MATIDVDFDVFKALTMRRSSEDVTENDVLRELLGLPPKRPSQSPSPQPTQVETHSDWIVKGVRLPAGTELRASYKGKTYLARVEGGALVLNGERFDTPSAAAMSITKNPVNGWTFWEARLSGQTSWRMLKALRSK